MMEPRRPNSPGPTPNSVVAISALVMGKFMPNAPRMPTAVMAIACSTGKNSANAGSSSVPRPKPEKKVSIEASSATAQTTR